MASRAGIALSRLTYDAQFAITRVDGFPGPAVFRPPTIHTLSETYTIKDMMDTFESIIDFDLTEDENRYTIAFPIAANPEQRKAIQHAKSFSHDHFYAWVNGVGWNDWKEKHDGYLLFIDLTPGQVVANRVYGNVGYSEWSYRRMSNKLAILSEEEQADVESWIARDVFHKLIKSVLPPNNESFALVGILRPEGSFPNLSASELESMFNSAHVQWIQLTDLSYGAATSINRFTFVYDSDGWNDTGSGPTITPLPVGITLANGKTITIIPASAYCPVKRKIFFTNSQDNQTTATIKVLRGTTPVNELKFEGLSSKPKGEAIFKIMFEITYDGDAILAIEEVGTNNKVHRDLFGILNSNKTEMDAYEKEMMNKQVDMTIGTDGVVGELPA